MKYVLPTLRPFIIQAASLTFTTEKNPGLIILNPLFHFLRASRVFMLAWIVVKKAFWCHLFDFEIVSGPSLTASERRALRICTCWSSYFVKERMPHCVPVRSMGTFDLSLILGLCTLSSGSSMLCTCALACFWLEFCPYVDCVRLRAHGRCCSRAFSHTGLTLICVQLGTVHQSSLKSSNVWRRWKGLRLYVFLGAWGPRWLSTTGLRKIHHKHEMMMPVLWFLWTMWRTAQPCLLQQCAVCMRFCTVLLSCTYSFSKKLSRNTVAP